MNSDVALQVNSLVPLYIVLSFNIVIIFLYFYVVDSVYT